MEAKNIQLEKLIKRNDILRPKIFVSFPTSEELNRYKEKIKTEIKEYFENQEQIRILEWELMTPEERQHQIEVAQKIKAKIPNNEK